jgi:hypothetical protein
MALASPCSGLKSPIPDKYKIRKGKYETSYTI